jgi:signal transduction histidine kinase
MKYDYNLGGVKIFMSYIVFYRSPLEEELYQLLEKMPFSMLVAEDMAQMLALINDYRPFVILLDFTQQNQTQTLSLLATLKNRIDNTLVSIVVIAPIEEKTHKFLWYQDIAEMICIPLIAPEVTTRLLRLWQASQKTPAPAASDSASPIITEQRLTGAANVLEHDLRSPSGIAVSSLDLLNEILRDVPAVPPEVFELLDNSMVALDRQLTLIQDLIDWIRLEAGQFDFIPGPVNVQNAIEQAIKSGQMLAETNGIILQTEIEDNLATISGDADLLRRVIQAALDTALKFCLRGQVITLSARPDKNGIIITVSDNGKAILPQFGDNQLFQLEVQNIARQSGSRSSVGAGLLFCRAGIERMGGHAHIFTDAETGITHLQMWLPVS